MINKYNILNGVKSFSSGIFQNYLVFMTHKKYNKYFNSTNQIYLWKSNGISEESIENIAKSNSRFAPAFVNRYILSDVTFYGHCLINNNTSIPKKVIHMYIFLTY